VNLPAPGNAGPVNAANVLTLSRLLATLPVIALMYGAAPAARYGALAVFLAAMLTDVFDGLLARRSRRTVLGNYLDPVADKTLILCVFAALGERGVLPIWMALVLIARELIVSGVRDVAAHGGRLIGANWMGKSKTFLQSVTIAWALFMWARAPAMGDWKRTLEWRSLWWLGTATVAVSVAFAAAFVVWNRRLLTGRSPGN